MHLEVGEHYILKELLQHVFLRNELRLKVLHPVYVYLIYYTSHLFILIELERSASVLVIMFCMCLMIIRRAACV